MITMDAFRADAFSAVTLTAAVDKLGYVPQYLGTVPGLFNDTPVRTTAVWIEERSNAPALIQTTERAAAPKVRGAEQRAARDGPGRSARARASWPMSFRAFAPLAPKPR